MTHDAETLNATVRYTMWTVFALEEVLPEDDDERAELIAAAQAAVGDLPPFRSVCRPGCCQMRAESATGIPAACSTDPWS